MNLFIFERGEKHSPPEAESFRTITEWKKLLAANGVLRETSDPDAFELIDPQGRSHRLSFAPWASQSPDTTFLAIGFRWRDPSKIGRAITQATTP